MKSQVIKLIQMGVIPCDKELSNEMFKEILKIRLKNYSKGGTSHE